MRAKERKLVETAVENGVQYGMARAFKHRDCPHSPTELNDITQVIIQKVMDEIDDWFDFPDDPEIQVR